MKTQEFSRVKTQPVALPNLVLTPRPLLPPKLRLPTNHAHSLTVFAAAVSYQGVLFHLSVSLFLY